MPTPQSTVTLPTHALKRAAEIAAAAPPPTPRQIALLTRVAACVTRRHEEVAA